jgi:hypothetical protein
MPPMPPPPPRNRLLYGDVPLAVSELVTVAGPWYLTHRLTRIFEAMTPRSTATFAFTLPAMMPETGRL